jgi:hypothetical protein
VNAIVQHSSSPVSGNSMTPQNMDQAVRLAEMMSRGKLVPSHLQSSPGDCLMVIELAMRLGMSPFAVAQCTSVISGKLMLEGKLVAAAVESSGQIVGHLDYAFSGTGDNRSITVSATRRGEAEPRMIELALKDAKTTNGMWVKQTEQQLVYAGTRVWARRWLPSVMLGVYSPEEMTTPEPAFVGVTVDAEPQTRETINAETAPKAPDPVNTIRDRLTKCATAAHVLKLGEAWRATVDKAAAAGRPITETIREVVQDLIAARYSELQVLPDELPAQDADPAPMAQEGEAA